MLNVTFLESPEDIAWLHVVHGIDIENVAVAELYGSEDCPMRVLTYTRNDWREKPVTWLRDEHGTLVLATTEREVTT